MPPRRHAVRGRTRASLALAASLAGALASTAPADASTGGASATPAPLVSGVTCRGDCAGVSAARAGSTVEVVGHNLAPIVSVVFLGRRGPRDDVAATPQSADDRSLSVRVPTGARSGRVAVINADSVVSPRSRARLRIVRGGRSPARRRSGSEIEATVLTRKAFFDSAIRAGVSFLVAGDRAVDVAVDLVRARDGAPIFHWDVPAVAPGAVQTVTWDGIAGGAVQRDGRYEFRVAAREPVPAGGARASTATIATADPQSFLFLRDMFPVRGAHDYGGASALFGAKRKGHRHEGHDVMADCGTPLAAARGGVVKKVGVDDLAGNYIVIDGEQTGLDYAYMHLREPAVVPEDARVETGQPIGVVGRTGRATACHLHFEVWSTPGWYTGGAPKDPLRYLRAWDRFS